MKEILFILFYKISFLKEKFENFDFIWDRLC